MSSPDASPTSATTAPTTAAPTAAPTAEPTTETEQPTTNDAQRATSVPAPAATSVDQRVSADVPADGPLALDASHASHHEPSQQLEQQGQQQHAFTTPHPVGEQVTSQPQVHAPSPSEQNASIPPTQPAPAPAPAPVPQPHAQHVQHATTPAPPPPAPAPAPAVAHEREVIGPSSGFVPQGVGHLPEHEQVPGVVPSHQEPHHPVPATDQSAWLYQTWGQHDMDGVAQAAAVAAAAAAAANHVGQQQPLDMGATSSEGRKQRRPTDPSKRAEQNRVAQRNFRMRRDARFKLLQEQSQQLARLSQENIQMQGRWAELLSLANKFRSDNHALRVTIATLAQQTQTPTAREAIEAALRTVREKEAQAQHHPPSHGEDPHPLQEGMTGTAEEGANQLMNLEGQPELPQLFSAGLPESENGQPQGTGSTQENEALRNLMVAAMSAPRAEAGEVPDQAQQPAHSTSAPPPAAPAAPAASGETESRKRKADSPPQVVHESQRLRSDPDPEEAQVDAATQIETPAPPVSEPQPAA